jgi:hypothetical protein
MNLKKYKHLFNIHLAASTAVSALFHFAFILAALFLWTELPNLERDQPIFKELQVQFKAAPKHYLDITTIEEILLELEGTSKWPTDENGKYSPSPPSLSIRQAFPRL